MCVASSALRVKQQKLNLAVQHLQKAINPMTKARLAEAAVVAALDVINELANRVEQLEAVSHGEG